MSIQATIQHFKKVYQLMWPVSTKKHWSHESIKMAPSFTYIQTHLFDLVDIREIKFFTCSHGYVQHLFHRTSADQSTKK